MSKTERQPKASLRRAAVILSLLVTALIAFLLYFPGRQSLLALTLASGIGIGSLQARVDALEQRASGGQPFTQAWQSPFSSGQNGMRRST